MIALEVIPKDECFVRHRLFGNDVCCIIFGIEREVCVMNGEKILGQRNISKTLFHVGQLILYLLASNLMISTLVFLLGGSVDAWLLPISTATAILLLLFFYDEKRDAKSILIEVVVAFVLFLLFSCFCGNLYDTSYDGCAYHKLAVGMLRDGWSPIWQQPYAFSSTVFGVDEVGCTLWVEAYCKQPWIFAASLYCITGNIENGKMYTLLAMCCVLFLTYGYLRKKGKSRKLSMFVAIAATANPVSIAQFDSYYVDGYLHAILWVLVVGLTMNVEKNCVISREISASILVSAMLICANIKFTGLLYGGIYCIAYFILWAIMQMRQEEGKWFPKVFKEFRLYALLAVVCFVWAGMPTYVTNMVNHGTPTYPLTGKEPRDIVTYVSPRTFVESSGLESLVLSLFSKMDSFNYNIEREPVLKAPFAVYKSEFDFLDVTDARISGFGIWFGGIFVITAIVLLVYLLKKKEKTETYALVVINVLTSIFLCIVIKESWWARYAPYIYFLVVIALYIVIEFCENRNSSKGGKRANVLAVVLFLLIVVNGMSFARQITTELIRSKMTDLQFRELAKVEEVYFDYGEYAGIYYNIRDAGLEITVDNTLMSNGVGERVFYGYVTVLPK